MSIPHLPDRQPRPASDRASVRPRGTAAPAPGPAAGDVHVELVGHATLILHAGGKSLITDPWLLDPIGAGSAFHFPPLVHDLAEVAARTDAIHLSHAHPDHFHPPTLAAFPRHLPVYLGRYARKGFRDAVRALGFHVVEVPFGEPTRVERTDFEITLLEHDVVTGGNDSALVVQTPAYTLFENNDCLLRAETYERVRRCHAIDYAFLGYSPAGPFPICFEMPPAEKDHLLAAAAERRFTAFQEAASILRPRLTIPYANGMRFLSPHSLWKNVAFSSGGEAVRRMRRLGLPAEAMRPGDRILAPGRVHRVERPGDADERTAIAACAAKQFPDGPAAHPAEAVGDLAERLRRHVLDRWRATRAARSDIDRPVIAYEIAGATVARCFFDLSRSAEDAFAWGAPPRYDMRYRYPAWALRMALDGEIAWEELDFADDVSIHQVRYAEGFCRMLADEPPGDGEDG